MPAVARDARTSSGVERSGEKNETHVCATLKRSKFTWTCSSKSFLKGPSLSDPFQIHGLGQPRPAQQARRPRSRSLEHPLLHRSCRPRGKACRGGMLHSTRPAEQCRKDLLRHGFCCPSFIQKYISPSCCQIYHVSDPSMQADIKRVPLISKTQNTGATFAPSYPLRYGTADASPYNANSTQSVYVCKTRYLLHQGASPPPHDACTSVQYRARETRNNFELFLGHKKHTSMKSEYVVRKRNSCILPPSGVKLQRHTCASRKITSLRPCTTICPRLVNCPPPRLRQKWGQGEEGARRGAFTREQGDQ